MSVDRTGAAGVLDQIAACLELQGENQFRVRAFRTAAKAVRGLPVEPAQALADGTLAATKGVGPATLGIVKELVTVGRCELLEQLREDIPPGMVEMLRISGLGVTRIRTIHQKLQIETLAELEDAARDGRLAALPGFGSKIAETVLKGIAFVRRVQAFRLSHHAAEEAELLRAALERLPGVSRAIVAGEVRRRSEVVRDLVMVLVAEVPADEVFRSLAHVPGLEEIAGEDERRATLRTPGGMGARIVVTPAVNLGAVLVQATGSDAHLQGLAAHAASLGFVEGKQLRPDAGRAGAIPGSRSCRYPARASGGQRRGRAGPVRDAPQTRRGLRSHRPAALPQQVLRRQPDRGGPRRGEPRCGLRVRRAHRP